MYIYIQKINKYIQRSSWVYSVNKSQTKISMDFPYVFYYLYCVGFQSYDTRFGHRRIQTRFFIFSNLCALFNIFSSFFYLINISFGIPLSLTCWLSFVFRISLHYSMRPKTIFGHYLSPSKIGWTPLSMADIIFG